MGKVSGVTIGVFNRGNHGWFSNCRAWSKVPQTAFNFSIMRNDIFGGLKVLCDTIADINQNKIRDVMEATSRLTTGIPFVGSLGAQHLISIASWTW